MTHGRFPSTDVHPAYWFDDGSIVLHVQEQLFRVHLSLLSRLSPFFATLGTAGAATSSDAGDFNLFPESVSLVHLVGFTVDLSAKIAAPDLEILLQHLYHDM